MASRQLRVFIVGDASDAERAAGRVEKRFGAMGSKMSSIGQKVGKVFKGAAVTAGAAIVTTLGAAVKTGWDRLASLERSEKMFTQMGFSAEETKRAMDRLDKTVTGTAFSLDEGAASMASLVSSGVGLDQVGRHMDLIADAAAYGQAPLGEVSDVFRRIQTQGKLTARELRMLTDRNIPAFEVLAAGVGVAADEIGGMVTRGEIDAATFVNAWEQGAKKFGEQGIVMEGAAKSMGDTVSGALGNTKTALARFGAVLVGPLFRAMPKILEAATKGLNSLKDSAEGGMKALGDWVRNLDFGRVVDVLRKAIPIFQKVGGILLDFGKIAGDAVPLAFGVFITSLDAVLTALNPLVTVLKAATGWLADHSTLVIAAAAAWATWKAVSTLWGAMSGQLGGLVGNIKFFFETLQGVAATRGVSTFKAGVEGLKSSFSGLAAGAIPLAIGALFAFAEAGRKSRERVQAEVQSMKDGMEDSLAGMGETLDQLRQKNEEAQANLRTDSFRDAWWGNAYDTLGDAVQRLGSVFGVAETKIADSRNAMKITEEEAAALEAKMRDLTTAYRDVGAVWEDAPHAAYRTRDISDAIGEAAEEAEKWRIKLGLSVDEAIRLHGEGKLEETLTAARDAAQNGTPAMDSMAGAIETLADETADSTERLKAWKDAVDAALGGQKNVTDSTISYKDQMAKLAEQIKENSGSFDINTEAGRENLGTLSSLIDRSVDLAGAIGEQTGSTKDAHAALVAQREEIIKGLSSVMDREAAEKLLSEQFGFSANNLNEVASKATAARRGIEDIPTHKVVNIEWNETKRTTIMEQRLQDWSDYGRHYARRHSGGVFRAPRPGGEGLALLRDGERVLTPNQQSHPAPRAGAPVHHTTIVQVQVDGSVTSDEDLLTFIDDGLKRRRTRSPYVGSGI